MAPCLTETKTIFVLVHQVALDLGPYSCSSSPHSLEIQTYWPSCCPWTCCARPVFDLSNCIPLNSYIVHYHLLRQIYIIPPLHWELPGSTSALLSSAQHLPSLYILYALRQRLLYIFFLFAFAAVATILRSVGHMTDAEDVFCFFLFLFIFPQWIN